MYDPLCPSLLDFMSLHWSNHIRVGRGHSQGTTNPVMILYTFPISTEE